MLIYLSFAGEEGFRGACIVHGSNVLEGAMQAKRLGINPGGEVIGVPLPVDFEGLNKYPINKLLSADELRSIDPTFKRLVDWEKEQSKPEENA